MTYERARGTVNAFDYRRGRASSPRRVDPFVGALRPFPGAGIVIAMVFRPSAENGARERVLGA